MQNFSQSAIKDNRSRGAVGVFTIAAMVKPGNP